MSGRNSALGRNQANLGSRSGLPSSLIGLWSWAGYLTFLWASFFICKLSLRILPYAQGSFWRVNKITHIKKLFAIGPDTQWALKKVNSWKLPQLLLITQSIHLKFSEVYTSKIKIALPFTNLSVNWKAQITDHKCFEPLRWIRPSFQTYCCCIM